MKKIFLAVTLMFLGIKANALSFTLTIPANFDFDAFISSCAVAAFDLTWDGSHGQDGDFHQEGNSIVVGLFEENSSHKVGTKTVVQTKLTTTCGEHGLPIKETCTLADYQPILQNIADTTPPLP